MSVLATAQTTSPDSIMEKLQPLLHLGESVGNTCSCVSALCCQICMYVCMYKVVFQNVYSTAILQECVRLCCHCGSFWLLLKSSTTNLFQM